MERKAYGKINLSLDVVRRRDDGYHDLEMIMQEIDIFDNIIVEEIEGDRIEVDSDSDFIPKNSDNIVYRISYTIKQKYNIDKGIRIFIEKNIPVASGLAGGSTDAASVMLILNEMWNLGMTKEDMVEISKGIGADIPFFVYGKTALAEGIGDRLTPLADFSGRKVLLVNPGIEVNTGYVYKNIKLNDELDRPDNAALIEYIKKGDSRAVAENMKNVLESVTARENPIIEEIKADMIQYGALGSMMSGSGSTVFGIFEDDDSMEKASIEFKKRFKAVFTTETL